MSAPLTRILYCVISEKHRQAADMSSLEMELDSAEENLSDDILNLSTADIQARTRLLDNEVSN